MRDLTYSFLRHYGTYPRGNVAQMEPLLMCLIQAAMVFSFMESSAELHDSAYEEARSYERPTSWGCRAARMASCACLKVTRSYLTMVRLKDSGKASNRHSLPSCSVSDHQFSRRQ